MYLVSFCVLLTSMQRSAAEVKALHTILQFLALGDFCNFSTMTNCIESCDAPPDTPLFASNSLRTK